MAKRENLYHPASTRKTISSLRVIYTFLSRKKKGATNQTYGRVKQEANITANIKRPEVRFSSRFFITLLRENASASSEITVRHKASKKRSSYSIISIHYKFSKANQFFQPSSDRSFQPFPHG